MDGKSDGEAGSLEWLGEGAVAVALLFVQTSASSESSELQLCATFGPIGLLEREVRCVADDDRVDGPACAPAIVVVRSLR